MSEFLENGIVQSVIAALILTGIAFLYKRQQFRNDEAKILNFLNESSETTDHTFRSIEAITSETNLSEERVKTICDTSSKITRNKKEKESWRLAK